MPGEAGCVLLLESVGVLHVRVPCLENARLCHGSSATFSLTTLKHYPDRLFILYRRVSFW